MANPSAVETMVGAQAALMHMQGLSAAIGRIAQHLWDAAGNDYDIPLRAALHCCVERLDCQAGEVIDELEAAVKLASEEDRS